MPGPQRRPTAVIAGMVMTVLVVLFEVGARAQAPFAAPGQFARAIEAAAYDIRLRALLDDRNAPRQPVVIVDLDEASLHRIGRFPWPRTTMARLLEGLQEAGAAVVAFDLVFAEPEANPVERLLGSDAFSVPTVRELRAQQAHFDGDLAFGRQVAVSVATDVVFGTFLGGSGESRGRRPDGILRLPDSDSTLFRFRSWTSVLPTIAGEAGIGHVITLPDEPDGVIRRAPLLVRLGDDVIPSLALEAARRFLLAGEIEVDLVRHGGLVRSRALHLGDTVRIPLDRNGRVLIPYLGPGRTFPLVAAADVIENRLDDAARQALDGALVFVGTSAIGLADLRTTPVDRVHPGVEIQATIAHALIEAAERASGDDPRPALPRTPGLQRELTPPALLLAGVGLSVLLPKLGALAMAAAGIGLAVGWVTVAFFAWQRHGLDLPLTPPILLLAGVTAVNLTYGFVAESARRHRLRSMFDQYVPPAHIERILDPGHQISLEGESRVMTVLFADIRGFTGLAEGLPAQEVRRLLNQLFTPVTEVILDHGGTIDKYVGDMVMAFWNAPLPDPGHRDHAITAGLGLLPELDAINAERARRGMPAVEIGIGINSGLMNVGDMGSDFRRAYTVLGDAVNLGSRIEGLCRAYGVRMLVGEATRDEAGGFLFRFVDRVRVRGRHGTVRIYEPLCRSEAASPELEHQVMRYHEAYWLYLQQDWERAAGAFDRLIDSEPGCQLYRIYRTRIEQLRHADPGPDWDGAFPPPDGNRLGTR